MTWPEHQLRAMEPSTSDCCVNTPTSFHLLEPIIPYTNGSRRLEKEAPPTLGERQERALRAVFDYLQVGVRLCVRVGVANGNTNLVCACKLL